MRRSVKEERKGCTYCLIIEHTHPLALLCLASSANRSVHTCTFSFSSVCVIFWGCGCRNGRLKGEGREERGVGQVTEEAGIAGKGLVMVLKKRSCLACKGPFFLATSRQKRKRGRKRARTPGAEEDKRRGD